MLKKITILVPAFLCLLLILSCSSKSLDSEKETIEVMVEKTAVEEKTVDKPMYQNGNFESGKLNHGLFLHREEVQNCSL